MSAPSQAPLILIVEDFDDAREMYRNYAPALATEGDRARRAGCDGFIAKPCLPPDLVDEIAKYLKSHSTAPGRGRTRRS